MGIWRLNKRYWLEEGTQALYLSSTMRSLVLSLIGIFIPLYLYKVGLNLWQYSKYAIMLVALYYLVTRVVTLMTSLPISRIIERLGFRRSIIISYFFMTLNLCLLTFAKPGLEVVLLAALTAGLAIPFYWIARNSAISQDFVKARIGKQMGILTSLEHVTTLLGPVAAGLIVEFWGFQTLFAWAIAILSISIVPLWTMPHHVHRNGASLGGLWYFVTNSRFRHLAIGVGAKAVDDYTIAVIWPLTISLMGIKSAVIGGIFSMVSIVSLLVRMLVGRLFDKLRARMDWTDEIIFAVSGILNAFLWMARLFVRSVSGVMWVDMTGAISGTTYTSIYLDYEHLGGIRMGSIAYWVYVEIVYSLMVAGLMAMIILGAWYGVWKELAFLVASMWLVISTVMARESNLK